MSNTKIEAVNNILQNQDIKSFSLNYRKHDYSSLVKSLQSHPECLMSQIKMYIPLYHMFFSLNTSNYNSISLNHKYIVDHLHVKEDSSSSVDDMSVSVSQKTRKNQFLATLRLSDGNSSQIEEKIERNIFLKFSPLIDPVKYMINKYKDIDPSILRSIPDYANIDNENYKNLISYESNNTPYTDGFFTYLSSILLNEHNFPHGIDFYGSCLGVKQEFSYNIVDEIDYLNESEHFHKHLDDLFIFQNEEHREIFNADSRKNKTKLNIGTKKEDIDLNLVLNDIIELDITTDKRLSDTKVSHSNSIISSDNFYPGQQILSIDSDKKKLLHRIKAVTTTSIEIEDDMIFPENTFTLQLFHLSSVYGDLYNDPKTGKNKLFFSF